MYLEPIGKESVVKESMCNDELDHYNDEVKKFTKNKTTKIDIVSEKENRQRGYSVKIICYSLMISDV